MKSKPSLACLFAALVSASAAQADQVFQTAPAKPSDACALEADFRRRDARTALGALQLDLDGAAQPIDAIRFVGAPSFTEAELWAAVGARPPAHPTVSDIAAVLMRLDELDVFKDVTPRVRALRGGAPVLEIALSLQPRISSVVLSGGSDLRGSWLAAALLDAPFKRKVTPQEFAGAAALANAPVPPTNPEITCPAPALPAHLLAGIEGEKVRAGLLRGGVTQAVSRAHKALVARGYQMAGLSARLRDDGTLQVEVDEGHISQVDIEGVHPRIANEVRALLGVEPGSVFLRADLEAGLSRVAKRFPFLDASLWGASPPSASAEVTTSKDASGATVWRCGPLTASESAGRRVFGPASAVVHYAVRGTKLTVRLTPRKGELAGSGNDLIRHTPVTGFAPGFKLTGRLFDPADRAHFGWSALARVNLHRSSKSTDGDFLDELVAKQRTDFAVESHIEVPDLHVMELGAELHALTDTADRWRISDVDSYVYSALMNRPEANYFRRAGASAFLTFVFEGLVLGAEYRFDKERSMPSKREVFTLFNRDEPAFANPAIDDGSFGSLLFRVEWSSRTRMTRARGLEHDPDRSIAGSGSADAFMPFRTVNTVEVARPGLGSSQGARFVRVVSDSSAYVGFTERVGVRARARVAGRLGGTLPRQKEEALGGWGALRGYDFKELGAGDLSWLGTLELCGKPSLLSVFADLGAVHAVGGGWGKPRLGVGGALRIGKHSSLELAFRTDDEARVLPVARLLLFRTF